MTHACVITASDDAFAGLTHQYFTSLQRLSFTCSFDLGLLDVGLSPASRVSFEQRGIKVVSVKSDITYPMRETWESQRPCVRTLTARPYLREYFPGYRCYMWIDADVWLQLPDAIETMIDESLKGPALCIAPEYDRCYTTFQNSYEMWGNFTGWYAENYGQEMALAMTFKPMLNAGVFAVNCDSPFWEAWGQYYTNFLQKVTVPLNGINFMADQLALNILLYRHGLPCSVMPALYNWMAPLHALPLYDDDAHQYVEPFAPYTPIVQFHMAGRDKFRKLKFRNHRGRTFIRAMTFDDYVGNVDYADKDYCCHGQRCPLRPSSS